MEDTIVVVEYDPRWPQIFEVEKVRILGVIGEKVVAIEHMGSTAIPGLGAKPIIDIMVAVPGLDDAPGCVQPLQGIGYEYVPEFEAFIPERRYFRKGTPRSHHLHM
ncbi:MAG: GrpB family protein, partial [Anaerolineales bacterium]